MVDDTRLVELGKDVDALKDQVRLSSERSEKNIYEIRTIIVALAVQHSMNAASSVMEDEGDSQNSQVDYTPSDAKVKLAAIHLEGRALHWHQVYMKSRLTKEVPNWEEYVRALYDRFGTQLHDDPMAALMNFKQVGTVQDYLDKFDELLNRVDLSEAYAVSCLLVGLRSDIAMQVRIFHLKNLQEAICLTKLQEQAIYLTNKRTSHSTMRVTGNVRDKPVHILIDTGSTHNFLDLETVKRLGCKLDSTKSFPVAIANGNKMYSSFAYKNFGWKMQGVPFTADMMILPLGGCDVVLGVQWLVTLGDLNWNFHQLQMEFHVGDKKVSLRGMQPSSVKVMSKGKMRKILNEPAQIAMMHVVVIQRRVSLHATANQGLYFSFEGDPDPSRQPTVVRDLLIEFPDLFDEPKALPLRIAHDHNITLKPGTSRINVRLYRYPTLQKNQIERMIQSMLESGIIRHSISPHSSLIRMREGDIQKTIFQTHHGHYEFLVMSFGLTNAPSTFQARILGPLSLFSRVAVDPQKVQEMMDWPEPKNVKDLRGFLGLTVLALLDFSKEFIIDTDASGERIGAVLQQQGRPTTYISKALTGKKLSLSVYEKEMMAIVVAVQKWRPYLIGRHFTIKTNHQSLKYLLEQRISTPSQQKWLSKLMGYEYTINYKKGKGNVVVDALSRRRHDLPEQQGTLSTLVTIQTDLVNQIKTRWVADTRWQKLISALEGGYFKNKHYEWKN
ncbi:UNVERIFIED_CONTAM: Retrovirus-related Pol polyprotein from transposon [Sesamum radiatum]|uniref:Retrovirus-related Pol polyprotein from transposon n=1 Tax=Sesamum radiatum TaxID=300843 RepID=A0AAW2MCJ5_SESRA